SIRAQAGVRLGVAEVSFFWQTNYPMTCVVTSGSGVRTEIAWDARRFDATDIGRRLAHLETFLADLSACAGRRLADLQILSAAERQMLLAEWNDTDRETGSGPLLHELFEHQVACRP